MIRIVVETVDEAKDVRRVLKEAACDSGCCGKDDHFGCVKCVERYCKDKVELYKIEKVETPIPIVL